MANSFVVGICFEVRSIRDVVKVFYPLFFGKIAENIDVTVSAFVVGENVVVGNEDDFVWVPDFSILTEFAFENADGAGPQTSWVISTSVSTQMFSPGSTLVRPDALAKIFSVRVIPIVRSLFFIKCYKCIVSETFPVIEDTEAGKCLRCTSNFRELSSFIAVFNCIEYQL